MDTLKNTKDCLMIGSYVCGLNSKLFLHTDKNHSFLLLETEKHLHFDFVSVHVCSYIDLKMSKLAF